MATFEEVKKKMPFGELIEILNKTGIFDDKKKTVIAITEELLGHLSDDDKKKVIAAQFIVYPMKPE